MIGIDHLIGLEQIDKIKEARKRFKLDSKKEYSNDELIHILESEDLSEKNGVIIVTILMKRFNEQLKKLSEVLKNGINNVK